MDHGMLDQVVERSDLKETVIRVLDLLTATPRFKEARERLTSKVTSIQEVPPRPSEDE
jgi:acetyl-CoA carboxylase beta subunit